MSDLEYATVYLESWLILTKKSFDDHLKKLKVVVSMSLFNGKCRESDFFIDMIEYLG